MSCELEAVKKYGKQIADSIQKDFDEFKAIYGTDESGDLSKHFDKMLKEKARRIQISEKSRLLAVAKSQQVSNFAEDGMSASDKNYSKKVQKNMDQVMQNTADLEASIVDEGSVFLVDMADAIPSEKFFRDENFQRDLFRSIIEPEKYKFPDGSPVKKVSDLIRKKNDWEYARKRQVGYDIDYRQKRVGKRYHFRDKIQEFGGEDGQPWVDRMLQDTDGEVMGFTDRDEYVTYLQKTYSDIINADSMIDDTYVKLILPTTKGITAGRSFVFKSADAEFAYMRDFGNGNLFDQMQMTLRGDAKKIALAQSFSPEHKKVLPNLLKGLKRSMNKDVADAMEESIIDQYKQISGTGAHRQAKTIAGKLATATRQLTDISKLSIRSVFTTITDSAFAAGSLNSTFGGGASGYVQKWSRFSMDTLKLAVSPKARKELAQEMQVFNHDVNILNQNKFAREGTETGGSFNILNKMHKLGMKMTGLPTQATSARLAYVDQAARLLGGISDTSYEALYSGSKNVLKKLNISPDEWNVIRTKGLGSDGRITPAKLREHGEEFYNLAGKLGSYFRQASGIGSPVGSLKLETLKNMYSPDSVAGIAMRYGLQYKSFPIAAMRSMREISGGGNPLGNVAMTIGMATALGSVVKQMQSYATKGEFKDMDDGKFYLEAALQGGAGGLLADTLGADYSNHYINLVSQAAGPAPAMLADAASLLAGAARGKVNEKAVDNFLYYNSPSVISAPLMTKPVYRFLKESIK